MHALDNFSITIAPGELVALLGPSGCGKTTALRAVAGLELLDEGKVLVGGDDITHVPPHRRNVGMVFQAYSLFPNMNALENVAFGLEVQPRPRFSPSGREPGNCSSWLGWPAWQKGSPTSSLEDNSSGSLWLEHCVSSPACCCWTNHCRPSTPRSARSYATKSAESSWRSGSQPLFVTHDQEEALSMADRVGVMRVWPARTAGFAR